MTFEEQFEYELRVLRAERKAGRSLNDGERFAILFYLRHADEEMPDPMTLIVAAAARARATVDRLKAMMVEAARTGRVD